MLTSDSFPLSFSGLLLSPDEVMGVLTSVSPMGGSPFVGVTIPGSDVLPGLKLGWWWWWWPSPASNRSSSSSSSSFENSESVREKKQDHVKIYYYECILYVDWHRNTGKNKCATRNKWNFHGMQLHCTRMKSKCVLYSQWNKHI